MPVKKLSPRSKKAGSTSSLPVVAAGIPVQSDLQAVLQGLNGPNERVAEQEYQMFFDENPLPMWVVDIETLKIVRVNRAASNLYGYSMEEFARFNLLDLPIDGDPNLFFQSELGTRFRDIRDERPVRARHKKKNGEIIDVQLFLHVVEYRGHSARISLIEDITQRLKAESEMEAMSERFRLAAKAITCVIYDWDIATGCCIITSGLVSLLGFDPIEPSVNSIEWWVNRIHPEDRLKVQGIIARALADAETYAAEYRMLHRDGYYIYVWDRGIIVRDVEGHAVRVVGNAQDITDRKRMEAQLVQERNHALIAKESAEELDRLKTSFLANMSHEIRTPMTAILGFASILAESITDTVQSRQASIIESSAKRLLETINSILDLARIESQKITFTPISTDMNSEIRHLVDLIEPLASQKNLDLRFLPSQEPSDAVIDRHYLGQVVTNLLGNAVKFTDNGQVTVRLYMGSETQHSIPLKHGFASFSTGPYPPKEYFNIIVEDTGLGISAESLASIFDEFTQESDGYHREYEGTGLGLTISSHLMAAMGGSMEVRSARGIGSMFIVRIPRYLAMGQEDYKERRDVFFAKERKISPKILLVEDSIDTAEMVHLMVSSQANFRHAIDAVQAGKVLETFTPDLILMDINLGKGATGLELTKAIRHNEQTAHIPVVALTAYAMQTDRQLFLQSGCKDSLSKPFTKEQLLEVIERNLPKWEEVL